MSNQDLPQSAESASAYLDGELAATERAAAAADPEVMATVESFARVRAALSDIEPVAVTTKVAALAAALAEFDALQAPESPTAMPAVAATVISMQSRRLRAYRVLAGVAAAAVVVVAIAALGSTRGEDTKSSSSATQPPSAAAEALPQLKVAADTAAPAATTAAAAGGGGDASPQNSEATVPAIDTKAALQQFAATVESGSLAAAVSPAPAGTAAPPADQAPASGSGFSQLACISSDQVVLGEIFFQGTPAYAVRNTSTGAVQALDATDCHMLAEVPAP